MLSICWIPITVGPGIEVATSLEREQNFQSQSDFVFAFRLSKLKVRRERTEKSLNEISSGLRKRVTVIWRMRAWGRPGRSC